MLVAVKYAVCFIILCSLLYFTNSYLFGGIIANVIVFIVVIVLFPIFISLMKSKKTNKSKELIFISYKSESTDIARQISETLISIGYNVWFAEYSIEIDDYKTNIRNSIDHGIQKACKAIFLSSELYLRSNWCQYELQKLIAKLPSNKLFELKVNPQIRMLDLRLEKSPQKEYSNIFKLLEDFQTTSFLQYDENINIENHLNLYTNNELPKTQGRKLRIDELKISFDISAWKNERVRNSPEGGDLPQRVYVRGINGRKLKIHVLINVLSAQTKRKHQFQGLNSNIIADDRRVLEQNIEATIAYTKENFDKYKMKYNVLGQHLICLLNLNHYAFTYRLRLLLKTVILRKYVLTFQDPASNNDVEIVITAGFDSFGSYSLDEFLKYIPVFDEFVYSASYY